MVEKLYFGPAGVPLSSPKKDIYNGIKYTYEELKLNGLELEFTYGVRMKDEAANNIKEYIKDKDFIITCHAPYFINFNAQEKTKLENSKKMLYESAKKTYLSGGISVAFHPAWYHKNSPEEVYKKARESIREVINKLIDENINIVIRPETMELKNKFGDIDEVINLSLDIDNVLPAIDFAHLRYRYNDNSIEFFRKILEKLESNLGREILDNMHIHMSGITLDSKGTHKILEESDMPWRDILRLLKEFNCKGIIISESPNVEEDAVRMKNYFEKL
ncbi:endonuclease IV [Nanobdella aerobiophila]|uniref:Endonuclease IV n=2 Tax=Nanobdella aerobiophila TaxID=2586965 RepID=A0A915WRN6_9ARCH|nr:endonuclease IV [Nanobdella aerobiophila]